MTFGTLLRTLLRVGIAAAALAIAGTACAHEPSARDSSVDSSGPPVQVGAGQARCFRLAAFTDLHGSATGLDRLRRELQVARRDARTPVLAVEAGDTFVDPGNTRCGDAQQLAPGDLPPLDVAAAALGNHDQRLTDLADRDAVTGYPHLDAVTGAGGGGGVRRVRLSNGLTVAIVGLGRSADRFEVAAEAARRALSDLGRQAPPPDAVVVVAHLRFGPAGAEPGESAGTALARLLGAYPPVLAVVAGDTHCRERRLVGRVALIQPAPCGRELVLLDLCPGSTPALDPVALTCSRPTR